MAVGYIKKRDGNIVPFDKEKIFKAIWKAVEAVGGHEAEPAHRITEEVVSIIETIFKTDVPTVENIQDLVEKILIEKGHARLQRLIFSWKNGRKTAMSSR